VAPRGAPGVLRAVPRAAPEEPAPAAARGDDSDCDPAESPEASGAVRAAPKVPAPADPVVPAEVRVVRAEAGPVALAVARPVGQKGVEAPAAQKEPVDWAAPVAPVGGGWAAPTGALEQDSAVPAAAWAPVGSAALEVAPRAEPVGGPAPAPVPLPVEVRARGPVRVLVWTADANLPVAGAVVHRAADARGKEPVVGEESRDPATGPAGVAQDRGPGRVSPWLAEASAAGRPRPEPHWGAPSRLRSGEPPPRHSSPAASARKHRAVPP